MNILGEGMEDQDVSWVEWGDPMTNPLAEIDAGLDWCTSKQPSA